MNFDRQRELALSFLTHRTLMQMDVIIAGFWQYIVKENIARRAL
jgi:hypothetical protein